MAERPSPPELLIVFALAARHGNDFPASWLTTVIAKIASLQNQEISTFKGRPNDRASAYVPFEKQNRLARSESITKDSPRL
ncbi:MAG: hypothetical protein KGM47_14645 [Acidobacteriota bacterium]|nr:hypothetical protein [Acidobacteriota bacterium]